MMVLGHSIDTEFDFQSEDRSKLRHKRRGRLGIDLYQSTPGRGCVAYHPLPMNKATSSKTQRPHFAIEPGPGQESVWDYPRPPELARDARKIVVRDEKVTIAETNAGIKVMETASPPTFYIPREDVDLDLLVPLSATTYCEWKGTANYWALARQPAEPVAWTYERPRARFERIRGCIAFYPGRVECRLDGETARTQPGRFYGGWITDEVVGPFKGEPGTGHW